MVDEVSFLVLGAALTLLGSVLAQWLADRRAESVRLRVKAEKQAARDRQLAEKVLTATRLLTAVVRNRTEAQVDDFDVDLPDALIDDAISAAYLMTNDEFRTAVTQIIRLIQYPTSFANGPDNRGYPNQTQRKGLYLLGEAAAAFARGSFRSEDHEAFIDLAADYESASREEHEFWLENMRKLRADRADD